MFTDSGKTDAELLEEAYQRLSGPVEKANSSYSVIPKFYTQVSSSIFVSLLFVHTVFFQLPKDGQVLKQKLRAAARTTFLRKMNSSLMTHEELQRLWEVLEESSSPPRGGDELVRLQSPNPCCHALH